ncbi:MAG: ribosome biogenesis GTPase Der [Kiritimatiellae bacterium]|nr:ribosome biogenesis GTPase Der [Kiritimatiellia bacterium]
MSNASQPRAVALVGRPNVGKSALFNRILGRRASIVHDEHGVTRDRVMGEARWGGRVFPLIDTGGIGAFHPANETDEIVRAAYRQVDVAIEDAAVIIFVTDTQSGIHPLDEELAARLRRHGRVVLLAANKADVPEHEPQTAEFARLGFPVFPISAVHGRGIGDLLDRAVESVPPGDEDAERPSMTVAVVGRPNAGKSSFINRLLGRERVIVSDVPGTTRDSVEVEFTVGEGDAVRRYRLIDTAGMRAGRRLTSAVDAFSVARAEAAIRRADVVIWMIDAEEGPTRQDKRIAALIAEHERGCVRAVNKWDLMRRRTTVREYTEALDRTMPFLSFAPIQFMSAKTGEGVPSVVSKMDEVARQCAMQVTTGVLNRMLREAFERQLPPAVRGRRLKLYYAAQTGIRPVRLRLFVNEPTLRTPAYEHYLYRRLREAFGLSGAPIVLQWRARGGSKAEPRG